MSSQESTCRLPIAETIYSDFNFTGELKDVINRLQEVLDDNSTKYAKIEFQMGGEYDYQPWDLIGYRYENDEEFLTRINKVYAKQKKKRDKEIALMKELQEKYKDEV